MFYTLRKRVNASETAACPTFRKEYCLMHTCFKLLHPCEVFLCFLTLCCNMMMMMMMLATPTNLPLLAAGSHTVIQVPLRFGMQVTVLGSRIFVAFLLNVCS